MRSSDSDNMGLLLEAARGRAFDSMLTVYRACLVEVFPPEFDPLPARETIGFAL